MGRFVVLGMENAVATATAASIALNEVPDPHPAGNAGLHQAGPRAGEVLSAGALFFRPQMAGGNRHRSTITGSAALSVWMAIPVG